MKISQADLPAIRAGLPKLAAMNREHVESSRNTAVSLGSMGLEAVYRMEAVLAFLLDGSIDGFFHGMFKAAAVRRRFLQCVRRGMTCKKTYLLVSYDAAVYEALCSADPGVLRDVARDKLTLAVDPKFDDAFTPFFALALRLLCMGQKDPAKKPLFAFEKERGDSMEGQSAIATGILDSDEARFNKGLARMLRDRKEQIAEDINVNVGEQWLSVEALGLARLGISFGLAVTVDHPLLPRELLDRPRTPPPDPGTFLPPIPDSFIDSLKPGEAG